MGLRTSIDFAIAIGLGNSLNDTLFEREKSELLDTTERCVSGQMQIPANTSDQALNIGGVTAGRFIYLEGDREFTVKLNGTNGPVYRVSRMIDPASSAAVNVVAYFIATCEFTTVHLGNESLTTAVNLRYCIVGNLSA